MLIDLSNALGSYLYDVFVVRLDWWLALGFFAQALFTARFLVQWIASERAGKSVIPIAFWFFSIGGGLLLLVYALYRRDPVFIAGQAFGVFVYARNLYFELRDRRGSRERQAIRVNGKCRPERLYAALPRKAAKPRSRSAIRSSTSSSPIWNRTVGPPGAHVVAERKAVQSNGMARLSKPPHEAPMPNKVRASRKACTAACGTGSSTMLNRPQAPV